VSFWRDETSSQPDTETYTAVLPSLATTDGMLIGISTPYRKVGLLHVKHRDYYGKDDAGVLVVSGGTRMFNPSISDAVIAAQRSADPTAAASEWDAEFRVDLSNFLDDATIEGAIDYGRPLELPRREGLSYRAFVDASGGRHDHYVVALGHKKNDRLTVDCVVGRGPPLDPGWTTKEFAEVVKRYNCHEVVGDAYSAEWVERTWAHNGVRYVVSELNKSELYLEVLPIFTQGLVSLPNHERLIHELRLLERHAQRGGRDRVDHGRTGSDDYSNAVCGLLYHLSKRKYRYPTDMSWVS
jgi:hypothetical protein